eukprot:RCo032617
MLSIFQKKPTAKEQLRQSDREFRGAMRGMDRERTQLSREEQQLKAEIKEAVKQGNQAEARVLAKSLLQCRKQEEKCVRTKAQLRSVQSNMHVMGATQKISQAMGSVTKVMGQANASMSLEKTRETMQEFSRQSELMEMRDEMISEGIDSALAADDEDEETAAVVDQVLDEIGIDLSQQLSSASCSTPLPGPRQAQSSDDGSSALDDLSARLAKLREG